VTAFRTGRLDVQVTGARAALAGRIDDVAQLGAIATLLPPGDVVVDLAGVTFVNSIGMREWVRLVRVLRDRGTVTLTAVSDVLIVQLNMIAEFRGSVQIASFHAGYVCSACGREATLLVDAIGHAAALRATIAPRLPCPECGAAMDLADFPERYLGIFAP
jgi:DNA-directed RNA polymerase subunit RPC12/RpoP